MLTKNFFAFLVATGSRLKVSNVAKDITGVAQGAFASSSTNIYAQYFASLHEMVKTESSGVWIGNGKTPPTPDDYKLENRITAGFSFTNQSNKAVSVDEDGIHISATYGVTNTGTEPLEISEIGLVSYHSTGSSNSAYFMVERTVLETPIVIPPNETRQITYTISFRYPTA